MARFVVLFALAAGLSACASSPFSSAPTSAARPAGYYAVPGIQQSQFECVTDDGYGRFETCGGKSF